MALGNALPNEQQDKNEICTTISHNSVLKTHAGLGSVAHACNPRLWKASAGKSLEVRSLKPPWPIW